MSATLACIAGGPLQRALESQRLSAEALPQRRTPFGPGETILRVNAPVPYYVVPRQRPGQRRRAPSRFNIQAVLYALKDLGVQAVLEWSAAGAITHDLEISDIAIPDDVIDMTRSRPTTFFEPWGLGMLRQFPVFCPALRGALAEVLATLGLSARTGMIVAAAEGPRLETRAEIRMLAGAGAHLVTHSLAPGVFLAKELQMCFAGACYVVNYAETGSRHRPFSTGTLFASAGAASNGDVPASVDDVLPEVLSRLAERCATAERACDCDRTMAAMIAEADLPADWHQWFDLPADA